MKAVQWWYHSLVLATVLGCGDGQEVSAGASPAIRVHDGKGNYAQYISKTMPGEDGVAGEGSSGARSLGPVVNYDTTPGWLYQGQSNGKFAGKLATDAVAVAVAIPDVEKGYWVKPAGVPDPQDAQFLTWDAYLDVSENVEPGYHDIDFVGIDAEGKAGEIVTFPLCVRSRVPDNFNACDPSADAPNAVISLKWSENVDLDLQVVAPDGTVIDAKTPVTSPVGDTVDASAGVLDRDSNAGCVIDGIRYENLVWNASSPKGRYGIYVNLFSACKQASVHFEVSVYTAKEVQGAGKTLKLRSSQSGVLMDFQANGGAARGLFIAEFDFK